MSPRTVTPAEAREMLDGATLGPWAAYQPAEFPGDYRFATYAVGANTGGIHYVGRLTRSHANEDPPTRADARLMAAAPDLAATVAAEPARIAAAVEAERAAIVAQIRAEAATLAGRNATCAAYADALNAMADTIAAGRTL